MPNDLDQINVTTRRYIRESPALVDFIYNQDPLNYYMRQNLKEKFDGGSTINENFIYNSLPGGAYLKGKTFDTSQRQTEQQLRWDIKYQQVSVTLYQEDIQVLNKGSLAAIKLMKARIDEAYMSTGQYVSLSAYLNGQNAGYTPQMNGLAEAINDGVNPSWDGNVYPIYGGLTRATYSPTLNSTPVNLNGGILEYDTIDSGYTDAFFGSGDYEPNLMVTTAKGFSFVKAKFQTQQRFQDSKLDVGVGFRGLAFNGATMVATRLAPGQYLTSPTAPGGAGTGDPTAVTYLSQTSNGAITSYPTGLLYPSSKLCETLWILNCRKNWFSYYVSSDPQWGGGFRDFIPSANNTILVGQVLLAHNMTVAPRMHKQIFGFSA